MKIQANPFITILSTALITLSSSAFAADRIKQDNTTALNDAASWDVLPGSGDVAVWNSTVTAAATTLYGGNLNWQGIRIANPGGTPTIGASSASLLLTLGTSGIDLSAATTNLTILGSVVAGTDQIWTVDGGRTLQVFNTNTNSELTGSGNITLSKGASAGTAIFDFRPGQASSIGFTDQGGFYDYTGNWTINAGVEARSLRNGRNAWGSGTITLNGGTIAEQQNFSGTWTNDITLQTGSNSTIDDRNTSGTRTLKLQGVISGNGGLTIAETGAASYAINGGVILTGTNTLSGQVTIAANGVLRVGGVAGPTNTLIDAGTGGTLGTATVVNNGTLTLSHSDAWTFANNTTSGTGAVTIGGAGTFLVAGGSTQVVTMSGNHAYTGATTVGQGRLNLTGSLTSAITVAPGATLSGTGSTSGLLTMAAASNFALAGGATTTGLTVNGATFDGALLAIFVTDPIPSTVYNVLNYGTGTVTSPENLTVGWRGTLTNDVANKKYIFTAGAAGTRTWNDPNGYWTQALDESFVEGDKLFYGGDTVIFNNLAADSTVTLEGLLAPASVSVTNTNAYTFDGTGSMIGTMSLTKAGPGTLTLTTTNSYTGITTVNGGMLQVGNNGVTGSLGSGAITVASGAELRYNRSNAFTVSNVISGDGIVTKAGAGRMTVNGNNSGGSVHWNFIGTGNGDIGYQNANAMGGTGSTITLAASATGKAFFATGGNNANVGISLGAGSEFTWDGSTGNTTTWSGVISGSGALTKVSGETLILAGTNTYTGNTAANGGTLNLADNAQLKFVIGANGVNNRITGGGTLVLNGDFNLDLSGADPTNGNTWNLVNVATLTETFGATFTLIGFTESANVHTLVAGPVTWTFTEATGDLTVTSSGASDYNTWLALYTFAPGADKTPTGDPDNDGVTNDAEYAFGLNPTSGASVSPITKNLDKTTGIFKYTRRAGTGRSYDIETSTTLAGWAVDTVATAGQVVGAVDGSGNQEMTVTITGAPLSATAFFVRVKSK